MTMNDPSQPQISPPAEFDGLRLPRQLERQAPPQPAGAYFGIDGIAPHPARAREILRRHPEVRALLGRNPLSAAILVGLVSGQLSVAWFLRDSPWWVIATAAWLVGAYANHALWVLVHECVHHLIFRRGDLNRALAVIANLPMVFPATISFCVYHLKHHKYLGNPQQDADLAPWYERWLFERGFAGRLAWQCLFPVLQSARTWWLIPDGALRSWRRWMIPNILLMVVVDFVVLFWAGPYALLYLALSSFFSVGPHPLGARWIQEHYVFQAGQETYSYYGLLNLPALNIGYHNEHHDVPQIPWNRLPALRRAAPEMYDSLFCHRSWTWLWLRFLFDRKLTVLRAARMPPGRGDVPRDPASSVT